MPSSTRARGGNLFSCNSNNPPRRVQDFFCFDYSSTDIAWLVPWLCGLTVFLKGLGSDILVGAPITRLTELAVCRQYLSIHNPDLIDKDGYVDEIHCKLDDIQVELALILGVARLLSALIELLVSVPLGIVADRRGRKFALTLNVVGGLCYYLWVVIVCIFYDFFPPRLLVTCSLFYAIGGGPHMFSAFILAMIADVTTEKQRTRHFYVVQSIVQVVQLIFPAIGSLFLGIGLWIPFYVGLSAMVILIRVVFVIPETAAAPRNPAPLPTEQDSLLGCLASSPFIPTTITPEHAEQAMITNVHEVPPLHPKLSSRVQFLDLASNQPIIPLSLATFFFANLCRGSLSVLLQYISKRYGWPLSQEG
ncbi:MFS general substrate transporter [Choiromyces venosus 120613-1]|uniref:MFS general substrate transporter n=1 Tax=Choiromyces venosus 120613-1 TaxID=1336337 RepID=A0A3N4JML9_9PEZI|nr:MFS general substrate transporter [Choiromyces venosus 120613-1]